LTGAFIIFAKQNYEPGMTKAKPVYERWDDYLLIMQATSDK